MVKNNGRRIPKGPPKHGCLHMWEEIRAPTGTNAALHMNLLSSEKKAAC